MDRIITYNKEDLETTWAVFQWLMSKGGVVDCTGRSSEAGGKSRRGHFPL
jgi:hypothetical protein